MTHPTINAAHALCRSLLAVQQDVRDLQLIILQQHIAQAELDLAVIQQQQEHLATQQERLTLQSLQSHL